MKRQKYQKHTLSHTVESCESTKMEAMTKIKKDLSRPVQALCMLVHFLCIYVNIAHVDLEGVVFLVFSIPCAL